MVSHFQNESGEEIETVSNLPRYDFLSNQIQCYVSFPTTNGGPTSAYFDFSLRRLLQTCFKYTQSIPPQSKKRSVPTIV